MRVNVGGAKTGLSKLLARVEGGEEVEIAREGVPVARLVRIEPAPGVGARFLAARGSLAGLISIAEDFDLTSSSPTTCASTFSAAAFASPSPPITAWASASFRGTIATPSTDCSSHRPAPRL